MQNALDLFINAVLSLVLWHDDETCWLHFLPLAKTVGYVVLSTRTSTCTSTVLCLYLYCTSREVLVLSYSRACTLELVQVVSTLPVVVPIWYVVLVLYRYKYHYRSGYWKYLHKHHVHYPTRVP